MTHSDPSLLAAAAPRVSHPSRRDVLAGSAGFVAAIAGLSALASPARAREVARPISSTSWSMIWAMPMSASMDPTSRRPTWTNWPRLARG